MFNTIVFPLHCANFYTSSNLFLAESRCTKSGGSRLNKALLKHKCIYWYLYFELHNVRCFKALTFQTLCLGLMTAVEKLLLLCIVCA